MVGKNGMDHIRAFVIFPGQLTAQGDVGALRLVVHGLANIVQQACPLGQGHVGAQLSGHQACQVADLNGMLEHILTIAGTEAQAAQELDQLVMNAVLIGFKHGLFTGLADLVVHPLYGPYPPFPQCGRGGCGHP